MKLYTKTLLVLLLLISFSSLAQQGNNWYFGWNAGLSFSTSPPTRLLNGALYTDYGNSSISDSTGQLLFYTDGKTVYNRLHQVMSNGTGLLGNISVVIVPMPGSKTVYYIFTAYITETGVNEGYRYSIVDMSLAGGLGAVTTKNVLIYAPR